MKKIINKQFKRKSNNIAVSFLLFVMCIITINNSFSVFAVEISNDSLSLIKNVDVDNHNFNFTVTNVEENNDSYLVTYTYNTFLVENNMWKEKIKEGTIVADKIEVNSDTIMSYVKDQFKKISVQETNYLKKVQGIENKRETMRTSSLSQILRSLINLDIKALTVDGIVTASNLDENKVTTEATTSIAINSSPINSSTTDAIILVNSTTTSVIDVATTTEIINTEEKNTSVKETTPVENVEAINVEQATTTPEVKTATTSVEINNSVKEIVAEVVTPENVEVEAVPQISTTTPEINTINTSESTTTPEGQVLGTSTSSAITVSAKDSVSFIDKFFLIISNFKTWLFK